MDMPTVAKMLAILLAPTAVAGAVLWTPPAVRALLALLRRSRSELRPVGPPLESSASALRRLMAEHEAVRRSPAMAVRGAHLRAIEGALTDCALDAARAIGLEQQERVGRAPLPRAELRRLLGELADAGLVLPSHERFGR